VVSADRLPNWHRPCELIERAMKSSVVKRSVIIAGHKTSVSLEDAFWTGLREIAGKRHMTLSDLVTAVDVERQHGNLSSALRLFLLDLYRNQLSVEQNERDGTQTIVSYGGNEVR